jgi:hypothetical protein
LFADSGSFSAGNNNAKLFLEKPIDQLFEFYSKFDFNYIVEPDYIVNDFHSKANPPIPHTDVYERNLEFSAQMGILRALRMREVMSNLSPRLVRPIHGHTPTQRLKYLRTLERHLDKVTYIALGGLDTRKFDAKVFDATLADLKIEGIKKIHIFGRASSDALDYAISKVQANEFEEISVDSTTWIQKAIFRQLLWLDNSSGKTKLKPLWLKKYTQNKGHSEYDPSKEKEDDESFYDNLDILKTCKCKACTLPSLGIHERDRFLNLPFLAEKSRQYHPYYETLFVQKAALHNLCQQSEYIESQLAKGDQS